MLRGPALLIFQGLYLHLESHPFQRRSRRGHDPLPSGTRTGEANLVDIGVIDQCWTNGVIAADHLDDTRREDLLRQLDHFERRVRGKGGGLDDD